MVIARADCLPFAIQKGLRLGELKERIVRGLQEEMAVALQPASTQAEAPEACVDGSDIEAVLQAGASKEDPMTTRLAACQALAEETMCGEAQAAVSIIEMLTDVSPEVRYAALEALTCIADFGPRCAVDAVAASLALSDAGLRWRSQELGNIAAAIAARVGA